MLHDMLDDGPHPFGVFDQHGHLGGPLGQIVPVLLAQIAGDLFVRFVDRRPVDFQPDLGCLEVQRQRGPVADRVLERVAAQVAALVLVGAEGPERIAVGPIDGRAGQSEQERVGQRVAHFAAQVAFLRAVGLVHHHDHVRAFVQPPLGLGEFVDRRDQHFAHVLGQQRVQFLPRVHAEHVGHVRGVERGGDLRVQIDPVHDDDHRGVAQLRVQPQFLGGEDHQQRLAAALEMPNQAFLRIPGHDAGDHLIGRLELLVAADDLDAAVFFVGGEQREVLGDVQHHVGP